MRAVFVTLFYAIFIQVSAPQSVVASEFSAPFSLEDFVKSLGIEKLILPFKPLKISNLLTSTRP